MGFCDCVMLASESDQRAFFLGNLFYWVEIVRDFQLIKGLLNEFVRVSLCYFIVHASMFD